MKKLNCWEFRNCGREPGGTQAAEFGVCPAATERRTNGVNEGSNGGRACWAIAGTLCGGKVQGSFAVKLRQCSECTFYRCVARDQGQSFIRAERILELLR